MDKRFYTAVALAALIAVPAAAMQAAPARPADATVSRADIEAKVAARFAELDTDRDGYIAKPEADARIAAAADQRRAKRGERRDAMFARLDADKDGAISAAEFQARAPREPEARGARRTARPERAGMRRAARASMMAATLGPKMFERADSDRDGRVSLAEAGARPLAMFDRADADKDGVVTPEERRAAWRAFRTERRAS